MANKQRKEKKPNLETWLLSLARPIKKPVVITLLIKKEDIRFLTMSDFSWWTDKSDENDDEDEPSREDVEKLRKTTPAQHFSRDYIL